MKAILYSLILGMLVLNIGCNKSSTSSNTTPAATSYYWNGNLCYSNTGTQVATTYCSALNNCAATTGTVNSGYYWNGTMCMSASGQQVATTYCSAATTTNTGYYWNGTMCMSSTGQQVAATYCSATTTTGYYRSGNYCLSSATGMQVDLSLCNSTCGTTATTGTVSMQCTGTYIYNNGGAQQLVTCAGTLCRGYTLTEYLNGVAGRQVTCL